MFLALITEYKWVLGIVQMWHFNTADEYIIGTGYVHWIYFGLFPYEFRTISARLPSQIRILRTSHPLPSSIILWILLHQWMLE